MTKELFYTGFPDKQTLSGWFTSHKRNEIAEINGHIHTPHSFSAFPDIDLAFQMARQEGIEALGINDFYTTDGYPEFAEKAKEYNVFPLFNIELIALDEQLQEAGVRVNDPNNPGRTYFSGKGLRYPLNLPESTSQVIDQLKQESNRQTYEMVDKLNGYLSKTRTGLAFNASALHEQLAQGLFRERHIAQGIRQAVFEKADSADERKKIFQELFGGKEVKSPLENIPMLENEIRSNLLKSGGAAFVPEDPKAFLSLDKVIDLILEAGGIPCYPVLLDNADGTFTEYEKDLQTLLDSLKQKGVWAVEFIPGRNSFEILKDYVRFFHQNGFVVTFGTEHNTPQLDPLVVTCRGGVPLDDELKEINIQGAAVIAAHQYLTGRGEEGYLVGRNPKLDQRNSFVELGKAVIAWFCKQDEE